MLPPLGNAIEDAATRLDLEPAEIAVALGVTKLELMRIVRGRATMPPELAQRLPAILGGTVEDWKKLIKTEDCSPEL